MFFDRNPLRRIFRQPETAPQDDYISTDDVLAIGDRLYLVVSEDGKAVVKVVTVKHVWGEVTALDGEWLADWRYSVGDGKGFTARVWHRTVVLQASIWRQMAEQERGGYLAKAV